MKNLALLVLFFSVCFALILLGAGTARYLQLWITTARMIPAPPEQTLPPFIAAIRWALPIAIYCSMLLGLSYSARRGMAIPPAMICLFILSVFFGSVVFLGFRKDALVPAAAPEPRLTLGAPGLILSQGDTVITLLERPSKVQGSRVVSIPGQPLIYQELPKGLALPLAPFRDGETSFFTDMTADFNLSARQLSIRLEAGLFSFGIYLGALCLLLVSLRAILGLSSWPLANLFLGALAFRGVLALETLINMEEIQDFIGVFLGYFIPLPWISPLIFCALGGLIILNTALISLARGRKGKRG